MANFKWKCSYSRLELAALEAMKNRTTPLNTLEIVDRIYRGRKPPFNARQSVIALMTALQRKLFENGESFALVRTEREGPHPVSFWLAKKPRRKRTRLKTATATATAS